MINRLLRSALNVILLCLFWSVPSPAPAQTLIDTDHDGMSDALEQSLLMQFAPTFLIGAHDCSNLPAQFATGIIKPHAEAENGTIYGQVSPEPAAVPKTGTRMAEIHYFHLWRIDCGGHGHPLDTEHVAVLVQASSSDLATASWKALYWYAAAHENTVCDVSQIARAATLHAEDHGASVWISPGKHASYLNETLCRRGCGADRCEQMVPMARGPIINLGEPDHPMNGSTFIASTAWPLAAKMATSNFPPSAIARLSQLPATDIAWFNPGAHPAQRTIAVSATTEQALAGGGRDTSSAISLAGSSTSSALSTARVSTGNGLAKSFRHTRHALGTSMQHVGEALHVTSKPQAEDQH